MNSLLDATSLMGGVGETMPNTSKQIRVVSTLEGQGQEAIEACSCSMQGWQRIMEDYCILDTELMGRSSPTKSDQNIISAFSPKASSSASLNCGPFFGPDLHDDDMLLSIFDGHGGSDVSKYASEELVGKFLASLYMKQGREDVVEVPHSENSAAGAADADVGRDVDKKCGIAESLVETYLQLDEALLRNVQHRKNPMARKTYELMGSCAITAYINKDEIAVASLGDSRWVIATVGNGDGYEARCALAHLS